MKITMYELLGLVKDGKAPKKIIYNNIKLEYSEENEDYFRYYGQCLFKFKFSNCLTFLNDEIEIIEEDKEFEDIREIREEVERDKTLSHDENQDNIVKNFNMLIKWVNLLVRNQKRIIEEINNLKGE